MDIFEITKNILGSVGTIFAEDWPKLLLTYVVAHILSLNQIAKFIVIFLKKIVPQPFRNAALLFLDKLAKAIDNEIPDDIKQLNP